MAPVDQRAQIIIGGLHRNAAHGNVLAHVLPALAQRDVQLLRGFHRVVEEQLVEIAHLEKTPGRPDGQP